MIIIDANICTGVADWTTNRIEIYLEAQAKALDREAK
jgi:hypothetical protein